MTQGVNSDYASDFRRERNERDDGPLNRHAAEANIAVQSRGILVNRRCTNAADAGLTDDDLRRTQPQLISDFWLAPNGGAALCVESQSQSVPGQRGAHPDQRPRAQ